MMSDKKNGDRTEDRKDAQDATLCVDPRITVTDEGVESTYVQKSELSMQPA